MLLAIYGWCCPWKREIFLSLMPKKKDKTFAKRKLKVGKQKLLAANQTSTAFKTQKIHIPMQDIIVDNKLKQTLSQLSSHNSQVQVDACVALKSMVGDSTMIAGNIGRITNAVARVLIDENDQARKAIITLASDLFEQVSHNAMIPFFATLILFTRSALTHINERIRLDGLKFVKLLSGAYPALVSKYGLSLLENFNELLNQKKSAAPGANGFSQSAGVNVNSKMGLNRSRDQVLDSFLTYLRLVIKPTTDCVCTNVILQFPLKSGECVLASTYWKNDDAIGMKDAFTSIKPPVVSSMIGFNAKTGAHQAKMAKRQASDWIDQALISTLIDFWIESSEMVFASSNLVITPHFHICVFVLEILELVWERSLGDSENESISTAWNKGILKHIGQYFPFGSETSCRDPQVYRL